MLVTTLTNDGAAAVITPRGEIDFDSLPGLLDTVGELPRSVTQVTWDLEEAVFVDVAGLHLLVHQRLDCRQAGRTLVVGGLHRQPLRLLELAQELFPAEQWDDFLPGGPSATAHGERVLSS